MEVTGQLLTKSSHSHCMKKAVVSCQAEVCGALKCMPSDSCEEIFCACFCCLFTVATHCLSPPSVIFASNWLKAPRHPEQQRGSKKEEDLLGRGKMRTTRRKTRAGTHMPQLLPIAHPATLTSLRSVLLGVFLCSACFCMNLAVDQPLGSWQRPKWRAI